MGQHFGAAVVAHEGVAALLALALDFGNDFAPPIRREQQQGCRQCRHIGQGTLAELVFVAVTEQNLAEAVQVHAALGVAQGLRGQGMGGQGLSLQACEQGELV